ncbi:hypothetical protein DYB35_004464 [Aphanomyces astaci]|uniref:Uncharacterized protein n=1 Tax=Aphanomyces astaci TaxID=112090 RepID=A0A418D647_APHAT|nr:hypothetical protein DYB35_004464 [Aphanomyces astaci]
MSEAFSPRFHGNPAKKHILITQMDDTRVRRATADEHEVLEEFLRSTYVENGMAFPFLEHSKQDAWMYVAEDSHGDTIAAASAVWDASTSTVTLEHFAIPLGKLQAMATSLDVDAAAVSIKAQDSTHNTTMSGNAAFDIDDSSSSTATRLSVPGINQQKDEPSLDSLVRLLMHQLQDPAQRGPLFNGNSTTIFSNHGVAHSTHTSPVDAPAIVFDT